MMTDDERQQATLRIQKRIQDYQMRRDRLLSEYEVPGEFVRVSADDVREMYIDLMPDFSLRTSNRETIALFLDALQRAEVPILSEIPGDMVGGIEFTFKPKPISPQCRVQPPKYIIRLSPNTPSLFLGKPFAEALWIVKRRLQEGSIVHQEET